MERATLEKLAYFDLIEVLAGYTQSPPGGERVRALRPHVNAGAVDLEHTLALEARAALDRDLGASATGCADLDEVLEVSLRVGTHLEPEALRDVAATLRCAGALRSVLQPVGDELPALWEIAERIAPHPEVAAAIEVAISPQGEVLDDASADLREIRRSRITIERRLRQELDRLVRRMGGQGLLQESLFTLREGRFVLPVKADKRRQIGGIVHDRSASGETYFIEPASLVELGNQLRDLDARERDEILRILRRLTARVGLVAAEIKGTVVCVARLDEIFARARFGVAHAGIRPLTPATGPIRICNGRHPILERSIGRAAVVPLNLELESEAGAVLITGPNTGGKTVVLKTLGLLCLLSQTGVPVPADEGSILPVMRAIRADIGDGQSLEANLSTFSAHVANLARICRSAGERTLILLDEVGTGTDPDEGAALGASAIEFLVQRGARILATTHLGQLKLLATQDGRIQNAAMAFSAEQLAPTYQVRQGVPGHSYGIEIARRLGLPEAVVLGAEQRRGSAERDLAELTADVETRLRQAERQAESARLLLAQAERQQQEVEEQASQVAMREAELRRESADLLEKVARDARRSLERVVREVREGGAQRAEIRRAHQAIDRVRSPRKGVGSTAASPGERDVVGDGEVRRPGHQASSAPFAPGSRVRVEGLGFVGEVEAISGRRARIRRGTMSVEVDASRLRRAEATPAVRGGWERREVTGMESNRLDLRGERVEDAEVRLDRFIDAALGAGLDTLEIIHGKGTGALRRWVAETVQEDPRIRSARLGSWNEGGTGVTIATLRRR
jgi:DNA mismatch repair protein MutS2